MTVYVESNYLLELAFDQEQAGDCTGLLELAEQGHVSLVLPAFSFGECLESIGRRRLRREVIQQSVQVDINELTRSAASVSLAEQLRTVAEKLVASAIADGKRYDDLVRRLLGFARFIPLDAAAIRSGLDDNGAYNLTTHDMVILASVLTHLRTTLPGRAVFINRNRKDFATPAVLAALGPLNCVLKNEFPAGLAYIRAELARGAGSSVEP
jgi:predicted nucleic acid-binding protein